MRALTKTAIVAALRAAILAIAGAMGLAASTGAGAQGVAQTTKFTSYPGAWDTSHAGEPSPSSAVEGMGFDDEFDYLSVSADGVPNSKWYAPIHSNLGYGILGKATDRRVIFLGQGGLHLDTVDPGAFGDTDANIETMDSHGHGFELTNGYVEVRLMEPSAHGSHSGFWLLSNQNSQGHAELDVVETYGAHDKGVHQGVHFWQTGAKTVGLATHYFKPANLFTEFHTYGVQLTPTNIIYYFDFKETVRVVRLPYQQVPFHILLSDFTDKKRTDGYEPADMVIQYVRAWGK